MRTVVACGAVLFITPAFAQEASPPIDWSKPVIGVDGPPRMRLPTQTPTTVEIYTLDELKAVGGPSAEAFAKSLTQPAEPCDPQKQGGEVRCTRPQSESPLTSEMREKLDHNRAPAKPD